MSYNLIVEPIKTPTKGNNSNIVPETCPSTPTKAEDELASAKRKSELVSYI